MNSILALDCTLRDGGYCNQWRFGEQNIKRIISCLLSANFEIIECGFLTDRVSYDPDVTKFSEVSQLHNLLPQHVNASSFVVMMNYGEYNVERLPNKSTTILDGIRVAFHKKDRFKALDVCALIKEKGYQVYLQPMVSMAYSADEFSQMISIVNKIQPFAFYIVDSFGTMNRKDLRRYLSLADAELDPSICLGFHSHNNLQSAYANAQCILESNVDHALIIDSSIYGMGRGAGNLNSELFLNELNNGYKKNYEIKPILQIMDSVIGRFYEENPWGYSLPNYLSATHMIHPNYAGYLSEKKTLSVEDIDEIFSRIDPEKGVEFDIEYIEKLYIQYMSDGIIREEHLSEIKEQTIGREILLIAPGKSAIDEKESIRRFVDEMKPVIISINHDYPIIPSDFIFVSNIRRFASITPDLYGKTISTTNIKSNDTYVSIDYYKLLNSVEMIRDNATLMAIRFLIDDLHIQKIYLAGFDGYSHDAFANFEARDMAVFAKNDYYDEVNQRMKMVLADYQKKASISFVTKSLLQ